MKNTIQQITDIIKSYREHDIPNQINEQHIEKWVSQFEEADREFILSELLHILPGNFLTRNYVIEKYKSLFDEMTKNFNLESVQEILDHATFLRCQQEHKSQNELLGILDEILFEKYGKRINDCGKRK